MRQFIDDRYLGMALENRVEIHLLDNHAAIIDALARHHLESLDQCCGVGSIVRFDKCQHHVDAPLLQGMSLFEHLVSLTDAGGRADENLQPSALGTLHQFEEIFRAFLIFSHRENISKSCASSTFPMN